MKPRNAELSMLVLAVMIGAGMLALTDLGRTGELTADFLPQTAILALLASAGHWVLRRYAPGSDPLIYALGVVLAFFGYGFIRRLDPRLADAQLGWIAVGMAAFALTLIALRDHRSLDHYRYSLMLAGIVLLLLPVSPIGTDLGRSARLWVEIGGFTFQPAEAAKVVLATFVASYLAAKREVMTLAVARIGPVGMPAPRHFGPLLLAWGLSLAVMLYERDLGSSLLFFALFIVTLYAATSRTIFALAGFALFGMGVVFAYRTFDHVAARVQDWLNPWATIQGTGRQIAQSYFALGTGGFTGTGIAQGHPDLIDPGLRSGTLPTDFIFAAVGEELGLLGTTAVLLLFGLLVARGFHVALRSRDEFGTLLACGLTVIMGLQALLIMGGVSRLVPLTGITLPFVSYGGSSLVANFVLIALLMRISDGEAVT